MMRVVLAIAALAVAVLVWWMVSDSSADMPQPGGELVAPQARPAKPGGFALDAPPARAPSGEQAAPTGTDQAAPAPAPPPPARYAGITVRRSDGTLLSGVVVTAVAADSTVLARQTTDGGRFDFGPDVTVKHPVLLTFVWEGAGPPDAAGNPTVRQVSSHVQPDTLLTPLDQMRVVIDTGWNARGRVVDGSGLAIVAASVSAGGAELGRSRLDGTVILRDLDRAASPVLLDVRANGWVTQAVEVAAPAEDGIESTFEVVLAPYVPPDAANEPPRETRRVVPR